ncbi:MAG: helix-hairpin-helix domain-containing protein [Proteobacteria bacterium]|nr:helix-hairpin-helix domain-containing protein [Pseudomonadota bacterium]
MKFSNMSCLPVALLVLSLAAVVGSVSAEPINLNTADVATLDQVLVGIGAEKAKAIVAYRQQHGPFKTVDELALVKGIGPKVIERNRANMRVDSVRPRSVPGKAADGTRPQREQPVRPPKGSAE